MTTLFEAIKPVLEIAYKYEGITIPGSCPAVAADVYHDLITLNAEKRLPWIIKQVHKINVAMVIPNSSDLILTNDRKMDCVDIQENYVQFNFTKQRHLLMERAKHEVPQKGNLHTVILLTVIFEDKERYIILDANIGQFKHIPNANEAVFFVSPQELAKKYGFTNSMHV